MLLLLLPPLLIVVVIVVHSLGITTRMAIQCYQCGPEVRDLVSPRVRNVEIGFKSQVHPRPRPGPGHAPARATPRPSRPRPNPSMKPIYVSIIFVRAQVAPRLNKKMSLHTSRPRWRPCRLSLGVFVHVRARATPRRRLGRRKPYVLT